MSRIYVKLVQQQNIFCGTILRANRCRIGQFITNGRPLSDSERLLEL